MPIVSPATQLLRRRVAAHFCSGLTVALVLLFAQGGGEAKSQLSARLDEKKNVVKVSRNGRDYSAAPLRGLIGNGDFLLTGARSLAGALWSDRTYFRLNESSKVQFTVGTGQRDIKLFERVSSVYGNFKGPGRVEGLSAVCAVRGTEMEFITLNDRDVIRCFGPQGHQALVTNKANALITGRVTMAGAAQVVSDDLIGSTQKWMGAKLEFRSGPNKGQSRTVTAFDRATGAVTLNTPLPNAANLTDWFTVVNPPNSKVVVLEKNMETSLSHDKGAEPKDPYPTEPKEFAGG